MHAIETDKYIFRWDGEEFEITGFQSEQWQLILDQSGGWYEADLLAAIRGRYGTGGHYVDFGAFIGTHTIFFDRICKADRVTAVEPNPIAFKLLYENALVNGCSATDTLQCAVGENKGRSSLNITGKNWGCVSALPDNTLTGTVPRFKSGDVITAPPKLIKIDCESMTYDVLLGCLDVIKEHKPIIVIEIPDQEEWDRTAAVLDPLSYRLMGQYCHTPTFILEHIP